MPSHTRRSFLQLSAAAAGLAITRPLRAIEPFARAGQSRLRLSLAAYSFREYFKDSTHQQKAGTEHKLDILGFIDFCADNHCEGAELTSYYFPKDVTPQALADIRRHAFLRGVTVSGTSVGNNFALPAGEKRDAEIASVKAWIDRAAVLGAPHIRIFAGVAKELDPAEARKMCLSAIEECCDYAGKYGIFLGLENHGGIVSKPEELLEIVKAVKSRWFGVNLDTANFHTEDPYAALAMCAPYAVNVQIKADIQPAGKPSVLADLPRLVKILREAHYQGWAALEYESKEEPYTAVPRLLAQLHELFRETGGAPAKDDALLLFNGKSLDGWKVTDFAGHGEVTVNDGQMVLEAGSDLTGVNYANELPNMSYEVSLEAMRLTGGDFFCGLTLPIGEANVTFVVGGWGGSVVGISSINGDDASENETTKFMRFESNRWYRIRVRVAPGSLQAWVDDEQTADVKTEDKRFSMRAGEIELSAPFGIATFRTRAALRNIKMRRL